MTKSKVGSRTEFLLRSFTTWTPTTRRIFTTLSHFARHPEIRDLCQPCQEMESGQTSFSMVVILCNPPLPYCFLLPIVLLDFLYLYICIDLKFSDNLSNTCFKEVQMTLITLKDLIYVIVDLENMYDHSDILTVLKKVFDRPL